MDVGLHHRTIRAHGPTGLHLLLSCSSNEHAIDRLKGGGLQSLEVGVESRFRRHLVSNTQVAEETIAARVGEMEGQLPVAEAVHLFDYQNPQDLFGAQA